MRRTGNAALVALSIAAAILGSARAQEGGARAPFEISVEPPARVAVGDRGEIVVRVLLGPGAARPMLVTPTSEGPAIEIVQGRVTRTDAEDPEASILRFGIPFVARTAGTSVVRVRLDGFECDATSEPGARAPRCRAVQLEEARPVEVMAR